MEGGLRSDCGLSPGRSRFLASLANRSSASPPLISRRHRRKSSESRLAPSPTASPTPSTATALARGPDHDYHVHPASSKSVWSRAVLTRWTARWTALPGPSLSACRHGRRPVRPRPWSKTRARCWRRWTNSFSVRRNYGGKTVAEMDKLPEAVHAAPREQFVGLKGCNKRWRRRLTAHAQKLSVMEGKSVDAPGKMVDTGWCRWRRAGGDTGREHRYALVRVAGRRGRTGRRVGVAGRRDEPCSLARKGIRTSRRLANASSFEQAVHSLTAAVHLLTARTAAQSGGSAAPTLRLGKAA